MIKILVIQFYISLLILPVAAYQNPLSSVTNAAGYAADPCVIKWMGKYYLYHTDNYAVFESEDLVNWTNRGRWASTNILGSFFWAPDPFYYNGTFYLYWSKPSGSHTIVTASSPLGPFQVFAENVYPGIDGSVFMDDDGQMYFSYAGSGGFWFDRMSSPTTFAHEPRHLTACVVQLPDEGNWTEGPQIFKINGNYFSNYCGTNWRSPTYQVHAARGNSILDLLPQNNNPLIANLTGTWTGTGHNYVILGPDLMTYYTVYHARQTGASGDARKLMLDRLWIDMETGMLSTNGPTFTEQPDPWLPGWSDDFDRLSIGSQWLSKGGAVWNIVSPGSVRGDSRGAHSWAILESAIHTNNFFIAEFYVKFIEQGTTSPYPRCGVFVGYDGEQNGLALFIDPLNNRLSSYALRGMTPGEWFHSDPLPEDWDHRQWHTLRIARLNEKIDIYIDNMLRISRPLEMNGGSIGFILEDCVADFGWTAFSNCLDCPIGGIGNAWFLY